MTTQFIAHHGFRYCAEVKGREEGEVGVRTIAGWLLLIAVVGLTAFFVISFSLL